MTCGIYAIQLDDGRKYIGSAKNFEKRRYQHLRHLSRGDHHSRYLQRAWNKYGEHRFSFRILIVCRESDLFFYEQRCIDFLKPEFNVSPSACGTRGLKWSPESIAKLKGRTISIEARKATSETLRKKFAALSAEERKALSENLKSAWTEGRRNLAAERQLGRKHSEETKQKMASLRIGHIVSDETRAKLAAQVGWKHTEESKAKMRGRVRTEEHKANIAAALTGKIGPRLGAVIPQEMRDQISAKLKGQKRSPEAIAKQRATIAARRVSAWVTSTA